ncbi:MAG: ferritin [Lentisphaeria bacterium]
MIGKRVLKAINEQIVKENYSAWLYLQMAAYFEKENLKGFAHWLRIQAQEEACHGLIFFNHLCDRGGEVALGAVAAPPQRFKSPLDVFEQGLAHEFTVTASIGAIMKAAVADDDFAAQSMLKWFVDEQVEEEANFDELRSKLARIGKDGNGVIQLDKELTARVFSLPPPLMASMGAGAAP